jgi:hypothetical protein
MSKPWPPPPDLESLKELVRDADIEGFIEIHGAPQDEYDGEAEALYSNIGSFTTSEIRSENLTQILNEIWSRSFNLAGEELEQRSPALLNLAQQIERFFGPEAKPQVRSGS